MKKTPTQNLGTVGHRITLGSPSAFTAASSDSSWRIFAASTTAMASSRLPTLLLWKCSGTDRNSQTDLGTQMQYQDSQERAPTKHRNKLKVFLRLKEIMMNMMHLEKVSCNTIDCYMKSILALWSATTTTTIQAQVLIKRHLVCKLPSYGHMSMSSFSKTSARRGWELPDKLQIQSGYDMIRLCPHGTGTTDWDSTKLSGRDPNAQMAQYHMLTYCRLRLQEVEHVRATGSWACAGNKICWNLTKYTEVNSIQYLCASTAQRTTTVPMAPAATTITTISTISLSLSTQ